MIRCRVGLAAPALLLSLAAPALAQDERSSAPSLPDSGGEEAPSATHDRMDMLEERIAELGQRLRESEEARQKSVSPLSWNGYVDFGFFVPLGNGGVGWVRDAGTMRSSRSTATTRGCSSATSSGRRSTRAASRRTWATRPD